MAIFAPRASFTGSTILRSSNELETILEETPSRTRELSTLFDEQSKKLRAKVVEFSRLNEQLASLKERVEKGKAEKEDLSAKIQELNSLFSTCTQLIEQARKINQSTRLSIKKTISLKDPYLR
jgi:uncharacterized coiled-coil DUF342 family protein